LQPHQQHLVTDTTSVCPYVSHTQHLTRYIENISARHFLLLLYIKLRPYQAHLVTVTPPVYIFVCQECLLLIMCTSCKKILSPSLHWESKPIVISTLLFCLPLIQLPTYVLVCFHTLPHFLLHYRKMRVIVYWTVSNISFTRAAELFALNMFVRMSVQKQLWIEWFTVKLHHCSPIWITVHSETAPLLTNQDHRSL
jgi:hypothetical protein